MKTETSETKKTEPRLEIEVVEKLAKKLRTAMIDIGYAQFLQDPETSTAEMITAVALVYDLVVRTAKVDGVELLKAVKELRG